MHGSLVPLNNPSKLVIMNDVLALPTSNRSSISSNGTRLSFVKILAVLMLVLLVSNVFFTAHTAHKVTNPPAHSHLRHFGHSNVPRIESLSPQSPSPPSSSQQYTPLLPASVWATRVLPFGQASTNLTQLLNKDEIEKAIQLCGSFYYSTLQRAVVASNLGSFVYVRTGDIDEMWVRDSVVQMSLYLATGRVTNHTVWSHLQQVSENDDAGDTTTRKSIIPPPRRRPWLRPLVEGAIRRNAFNILQDPYANAYSATWNNPSVYIMKKQIIGRGGWVGTRNYELDSGAYFLHHLYDFYRSDQDGLYRPESVLTEPLVFEAVLLMIDTWIVEQRHDDWSPYRYFELENEGKGRPTNYTGMTWTGYRPSDDPCRYGYLIPANIHAAGALERVLLLNERIWRHEGLQAKATKLLRDIEEGIRQFGIVESDGVRIYAYEVDGFGGVLANFDDANVPSLLSIPLLGWTGYDEQVYRNTRDFLLSHRNQHYYKGNKLVGIGSPHTPAQYVWPMALVIQALTEPDTNERDEQLAFQMRQLLLSASNDAMHEGVYVHDVRRFTRPWFEWVRVMYRYAVRCGVWDVLVCFDDADFLIVHRPMPCL